MPREITQLKNRLKSSGENYYLPDDKEKIPVTAEDIIAEKENLIARLLEVVKAHVVGEKNILSISFYYEKELLSKDLNQTLEITVYARVPSTKPNGLPESEYIDLGKLTISFKEGGDVSFRGEDLLDTAYFLFEQDKRDSLLPMLVSNIRLIQAKKNLKLAVGCENDPALKAWGNKVLALTNSPIDRYYGLDVELLTYITNSFTSGYSGPQDFNTILLPQAQSCRNARILLGFGGTSLVVGALILGLVAAGVLASGFMFLFPLAGLFFALAMFHTDFKTARWGGGALEAVELLREMDDENSPVSRLFRTKNTLLVLEVVPQPENQLLSQELKEKLEENTQSKPLFPAGETQNKPPVQPLTSLVQEAEIPVGSKITNDGELGSPSTVFHNF